MPAGRPKSPDSKEKRVSMRVTEKDYREILAYAETQKITVAQLIDRALKHYMNNRLTE